MHIHVDKGNAPARAVFALALIIVGFFVRGRPKQRRKEEERAKRAKLEEETRRDPEC